ncbi:MAG: protease inhibitor I9 family protein, partial [Burkholderiales bacterium]|nr:protease inhibitor I9 family protein [Burkholderiales bacterium]
MNYRHSLLSVAVAAAFVCASPDAAAAELRTVKNPIPGQYIVILKDDAASLATERSRLARVGVVSRDVATKSRARLTHSYTHVLRGFAARADDRALARLLADPRVAYVQEDGMSSIAETQSNATWGIDRVDQRNLPLNQTYTYDTTASGVHAYVLDTGLLATHTQFTNRVGNGHSVIDDGRGTTDCHGHGTHVSGTLGGSTYGVAKGVTLHPVRVLGCDGNGPNSGIAAAMDWVAQNHVKPAVANMSIQDSADATLD